MNKRINNRIPRIDFNTLESTILCSIDTEFSFARGIDSTQGVIKQQFEKKKPTTIRIYASNCCLAINSKAIVCIPVS